MKNNIQKKVVAYIPEVLLPAELETIKNTLKVWWETLLEDDDIESSVPKDLPLTISESKGKITLTVSIEPQTAANKRKKPENKERVGAIIVYDKNKHSHIFLKVFLKMPGWEYKTYNILFQAKETQAQIKIIGQDGANIEPGPGVKIAGATIYYEIQILLNSIAQITQTIKANLYAVVHPAYQKLIDDDDKLMKTPAETGQYMMTETEATYWE